MGESGRAPTEGLLWGCGNEALRRRPLGFGPDASAIGSRAGDASGLPVVGHGEIGPRRRGPPGKPRGPKAPTLIDLEFLAGSDLGEPVHQLVWPQRTWTLLRMTSATMAGPCSMSGNRTTAMTGQQKSLRCR